MTMTKAEAAKAGYLVGTIKWFNTDKGYGFIVPEDGEGDVFLHATVCDKCGMKPVEGSDVAYKIRTTPKGVSCEEVKPLS